MRRDIYMLVFRSAKYTTQISGCRRSWIRNSIMMHHLRQIHSNLPLKWKGPLRSGAYEPCMACTWNDVKIDCWRITLQTLSSWKAALTYYVCFCSMCERGMYGHFSASSQYVPALRKVSLKRLCELLRFRMSK